MEGKENPSFTMNDDDEQVDHTYQDAPQNIFGDYDSFASPAEAAQATRRLSNFFKEILLPLAAETNAIIICSSKTTDVLSRILTKVLPLFSGDCATAFLSLPFAAFPRMVTR